MPMPYEQLAVNKLMLDPENPRLVEYLVGERPTQDRLLEILWREMAVDEIAMSIAASGYFKHEPLFVEARDDRSIVIEGNRRLAAVKLLRDEKLRRGVGATDLPKISAARARDLETLPVVRTTRREQWQYLGFKHVNGPAIWDSYPKAQYVATVHDQFDVDLEDIARQIGDKHKTVQRLYRALMVIQQAERANVFKREHRFKKHFSFSHLYTGLDYEGIAAFVKLKDESAESRDPVSASRIDELGDLCKWLYGDRRDETPPVVHSQNPDLRRLDAVLKSGKAIDALRSGLPLSVALEVSMGDERVFRSALAQARESLQKARATLSTGFGGESDLIETAQSILTLSRDLFAEMERKSGKANPSPAGKSSRMRRR